jgi:hypothetical protein
VASRPTSGTPQSQKPSFWTRKSAKLSRLNAREHTKKRKNCAHKKLRKDKLTAKREKNKKRSSRDALRRSRLRLPSKTKTKSKSKRLKTRLSQSFAKERTMSTSRLPWRKSLIISFLRKAMMTRNNNLLSLQVVTIKILKRQQTFWLSHMNLHQQATMNQRRLSLNSKPRETSVKSANIKRRKKAVPNRQATMEPNAWCTNQSLQLKL